MLIGCGDCSSIATQCDVKVLFAYIPVADTADETGSYCPGLYNCAGGTCVTQCSSLSNMIDWLVAQFSNFQNDTTYPWNTCTYAEFSGPSATTPSSVTGPGSLSGCAGGDAANGSFFGASLGAAELGESGGSACASAQIVGFRMQGNLFIVPEDVSGASEACLAVGSSGAARCSPGASLSGGIYYIPMPPYDLCGEEFGAGSISGESINVQYFPETSEGQPCAEILNTYSGCQSPDPFFGSDPP